MTDDEKRAGDADERMRDLVAHLLARLAEAEAAAKRNAVALGMLAEWVVSIECNGTSWDDWDEHYKDACYRPGAIREQLDAAILEEFNQRAAWDERAATKRDEWAEMRGIDAALRASERPINREAGA